MDTGAGTRLAQYFHKYELLIIYPMTVLAGFYSTIDLCQSRLCYLQMFNLQLKQSEKQWLRNFRFINVVLLEDIPQFIIQLLYLTIKQDSNNSVSIVYVSMAFSVLSIIAASLSQISRVCDICFHKSNKFLHKTVITGLLIVTSDDLRRYHGFTNSAIGNCIFDVLNTCKDSQLWKMKAGIELLVQVYYIQSYIKSLNHFEAYFSVQLLTVLDDKDITNKLHQNIQEMTVEGSTNHTRLQGVSLLSYKCCSVFTCKFMNNVY